MGRMVLMLLLTGALIAGCKKKEPPKLDLSNPRAAAISFTRAVETGDVETAKAAAYAAGIEVELVQAMAESIPSLKRLHSVAHARYGEDARTLLDIGPMINSLSRMQTAELAADEHRARLTDADGKILSHLKNVDGEWKVDVGASIGGQDVTERIPSLRAMGKVADQLAAEIESGKFETAADAKRELHLRMLIELRGTPPGATSPATAPIGT